MIYIGIKVHNLFHELSFQKIKKGSFTRLFITLSNINLLKMGLVVSQNFYVGFQISMRELCLFTHPFIWNVVTMILSKNDWFTSILFKISTVNLNI